MEEFLCGNKLIGDDFTLERIEKWFESEKEGYANLGAMDKSTYAYQYHELNKLVSYRYLYGKRFHNVLGLGSAYGEEVLHDRVIVDHPTTIALAF